MRKQIFFKQITFGLFVVAGLLIGGNQLTFAESATSETVMTTTTATKDEQATENQKNVDSNQAHTESPENQDKALDISSNIKINPNEVDPGMLDVVKDTQVKINHLLGRLGEIDIEIKREVAGKVPLPIDPSTINWEDLANKGINVEHLKELLAEKDRLLAELQQAKEKLAMTKDKIEQIKNQLESAKSDFENQKNNINELKNQLDSKAKDSATLLAELQQDIEDFKKASQEIDQQVNATSAKMEQANSKLQSLNSLGKKAPDFNLEKLATPTTTKTKKSAETLPQTNEKKENITTLLGINLIISVAYFFILNKFGCLNLLARIKI